MSKRSKPIYVPAQMRMNESSVAGGILLEILLLYVGLVGYLFCNTTALDMNIHPLIIVPIAAIAFGLMILMVWYKRVFFGILGGIGALSLLFWKVSFPLYQSLWRSLEVCYNYTVHLLASQPNYSDYKDYMTMDIADILKTPSVLQRYFYTAIIVLSLVTAVFFALALFRRIPPIVAFLVPGVLLVPFFFYGIVPHYIAFSVFLSAVVGCYGQSLTQSLAKVKEKKPKKEKKEKGKKVKKVKKKYTTQERLAFASQNGNFGMVVTAVVLLITIGTACFIYSRPIVQMEKVRQSIDMLAEDAMNLVFAETYEKNLNVAGYMEDGEALSLEVPRWRRLKVAKVATTTDLPVYLRYRPTMSITDEGWTAADKSYEELLKSNLGSLFNEYTQYYEYLKMTAPSGDPKEADLAFMDAEAEGYINDTVTVLPQYKASNILGLPGGTADTSPSGKYTQIEKVADTSLMYLKKPSDRTYSFSVVSPMLTVNEFLNKFQANQDAYLSLRRKNANKDAYLNNEFVYSFIVRKYYTTLPARLRNMVLKDAQRITQSYDDKIEKVQAIERYFRENYTYSVDRRKLSREDGTPASALDQIQYFLYQNEKKDGYCTLFASSMTAMLRSIGIPARVVTGYYVQPQMNDVDQYSAQVYDKDYHAWVEVYFDGMGWISFEPTPGFGVERNYYLLDLSDQGLEPEVSEEDVTIEYVDLDDGVIMYDVIPDPIETEPIEDDQTKPTLLPDLNKEDGWWLLLIEILVLLLLLAAVVGGLWYLHRSQLKKMRTLPAIEGVQVGYVILLRMMQMRGFKFFEGELLESFAQRVDNLELAPLPMKPIVPILQKGLFGCEEMAEEERNAVAEFVEALDRKFFRRVDPIRWVLFTLILTKKPRYKSMIWKFK